MAINKMSRNIKITSGLFAEEKKYWLDKLSGLVLSRFPADKTMRSSVGARATLRYRMPTAIGSRLQELSKGNEYGLFMILVTGLNWLLYRYGGQQDVALAMPAFVRVGEEEASDDLLFVLRTRLDKQGSFKESLMQVRDTINEARKYRNLDYFQMTDLLELENSLDAEVLNAVVLLEGLHHKPDTDELHTDLILGFSRTPDGEWDLELNYDAGLYKPLTIERLYLHLLQVLNTVLETPDVKLCELNILTEEERADLLNKFNDTEVPYLASTIVELYEEQVGYGPEREAVVFADRVLTYREVNDRSNQLARHLRSKGVGTDVIVGVLQDRSPEMMISLLAVMKAGGAYLPIHPDFPEDRIRYMLSDSQTPLLLTQTRYLDRVSFAGETLNVEEDFWYQGDATNLEPLHGPRTLAYVIYTSGTTGNPKGTMLEHGPLVNRLHWMHKLYAIGPEDTVLQKTPYTFDVSVWELFWWSFTGARVCFLEPDGEKDPAVIVKAIERYQVTTMHFVPSMLSVFLDSIADREGASTRLRSLRQVFASGEALQVKHVERFHQLLSANGTKLINLYGPTEATIDVSYYECSTGETRTVIPIGRPIDNIRLYILDEEQRLLPVGVSGELHIAGVGLARGYLNREDLTAEKFVANPFEPGQRMYRTGDLARWLPDGQIEYLGRLDHQVKIRGYRIELGELEHRILSQEGVHEAVVVARTDAQGDAYLCAYLVAEEDFDIALLRNRLHSELPDYMVPAEFVQMDRMPLSANGKLDRKALPEPPRTSAARYEPPRNEMEKTLVELWQHVLGQESVGIDDNFFSLGGHSLKATTLITKILQALQVEVPLRDLFRLPTVRELAEYLQGAETSAFFTIEPAEEKEYYPVSSAQKGLFVQESYQSLNTTYNTPRVVLVEGPLDYVRFEGAFRQMIERHESLRTSFHLVNGEIVQLVHPAVEFQVEVEEVHEADVEAKAEQFIRPFALDQAPLLRIRLLKLAEERHVLLFDKHHIISDGVSMDILVREFETLCAGGELPPLKLQYKDYSEWQAKKDVRGARQLDEEFWSYVFAGELSVLNFPLDYERPPMQNFEGDEVEFRLDPELTAGLKRLAAASGTTMYMLLMAAYNALLAKYSGQEDLVVGTVVAGRPHADLQGVMGMFINILAIRNFPQWDMTFLAFLDTVKERALEAFEHQDYPFEELVGHLDVRRDRSRNPLFDAMFIMQNVSTSSDLQVDGLRFSPYVFEHNTAKYDLKLEAFEEQGTLFFNLEYGTKLFHRETMERFAAHFSQLLRSIADNPQQQLGEILVLSSDEQEQLLVGFNDTDADFPRDTTVIELFAEQVRRTPEREAVVFEGQSITYREVHERSNRLARFLRKKGVGADVIVGVLLDRSPEMMVALLAVLKAGGAYLPIHPTLPQDRIKYMLTDSRTPLLLTQARFEKLMRFDGELLNVESPELYQEANDDLEPLHGPRTLAYVIYTSGTTGNPKGTVIEHAPLVNRLHWMNKRYPIGEGDTVLQKTPFTFDVSVWELFWWSFTGARVCFLPPDGEKDPDLIFEAIERYQITTMHFVPSMLSLFLEYATVMEGAAKKLRSLRRVFASGEALQVAHVERFYRLTAGLETKLINLYGPTEATIDVSYYECVAEEARPSVPIGKPIDNTRLYILDRSNRIVPIGVAGELHIAGGGLARGYLNREDLTAEKFVPNPFEPGERMYRTGDLARWLPDGNIEYLGRLDHQVKVRGYRIELGEVEHRLLKQEGVQDAVVVMQEDTRGDAYLCAYLVGEQQLVIEEIRNCLSQELPSYMVPTYVVVLEKMPLSANGKIDRKALPKAEQSETGSTPYVAPHTVTQQRLVPLWQEVLGVERIGIDHDFFQLGGQSLKASVLMSAIHKEFQVEMPLRDIFAAPTIRELAAIVDAAKPMAFRAARSTDPNGYGRISAAQKRLFLLEQMGNSQIAYNISGAVMLNGCDEPDKMEAIFHTLIQRHAAFRTSFHLVDGEPLRKVHQAVEFALEQATVTEEELEANVRTFIRPFDLEKAPLLRVGLFQLAPERHVLVFDMHHTIADGMSLELLQQEIGILYSGQELPPLDAQYTDFMEWQDQMLEQGIEQSQKQFWLEELGGEIPVLQLPYDFERPEERSFAGVSLEFSLDPAVTAKLQQLASSAGATMFMTLLAAYNTLLAKYSRQEDIIVGTPVAGRPHPDMRRVIGMFVNTLALRNHPKSGKTFRQFLQEVKQRFLQAMENQNTPFEEVVDLLSLKRDWSRNPLFDTMFTWEVGRKDGAVQLDGLTLEPLNVENKMTKFDIELFAAGEGDGIRFKLQYGTQLFKRETIERMAGHFVRLLESIADDPDLTLNQMEWMPEQEKRRLLQEVNETIVAYSEERSVIERFEQQVQMTPERVALIYEAQTLTYRELNRRANQLARHLREHGLAAGRVAAGMWASEPTALISVLAVWKTGAVYLPLDATLQTEQLNAWLQVSEADLLLAQSAQQEVVPLLSFTGLVVRADDENLFQGDASDLGLATSNADAPACLLYATHTDGQPQGALNSHDGLGNYLLWAERTYCEGTDVFALLPSLSFNEAVTAVFAPLISGGEVVIEGGDEKSDLSNLLEANRITLLKVTPEHLASLQGRTYPNTSLRTLIISGECLSTAQAINAYEMFAGRVQIFREYGPQGTATACLVHRCTPFDLTRASVPLGAPIANLQVYLLDTDLSPVPYGVVGELYISGAGVGLGYHNNPALTAEHFLDNPFVPGKRLFKTGDLAVRHADGGLEYVGRSVSSDMPVDSLPVAPTYEPPQSDLENELVGIWKSLLGIDRIGVSDNFFDLGGNSLKIISLISKVFHDYKIKLPFKQVANHPTIRHIAGLIGGTSLFNQSGQVAMLMNEKRERHLFAFPGIGGVNLVYTQLAEHLPDVSLYAFDFLTQENRLQRYVDLIQAEQAHGPYDLIGYSAGGTLAFEVAQELIARGESVSNLILLDTASHYDDLKTETEDVQRENIRQEVIEFLERSPELNRMVTHVDFIVDIVMQKVRGFTKYLLQVKHETAVAANIHLLRTENGVAKDWGPLTTKQFHEYEGFGKHEEMLTVQAAENALLIQQILKQVGGAV